MRKATTHITIAEPDKLNDVKQAKEIFNPCPKCKTEMERTSFIETSRVTHPAYSGYWSHGVGTFWCPNCHYTKQECISNGREMA